MSPGRLFFDSRTIGFVFEHTLSVSIGIVTFVLADFSLGIGVTLSRNLIAEMKHSMLDSVLDVKYNVSTNTMITTKEKCELPKTR